MLVSLLLALGPAHALAQDEAEAPAAEPVKPVEKAKDEKAATPKRRHRAKRSSEEETEVERASGRKPADEDAPKATPAPEAAVILEPPVEEGPTLASITSQRLPPRRYAYIAGGVLIATGFVFAYAAQGEAKRAETITSAAESYRATQGAQASAATANALYCIGGAAVIYALILELLPEAVVQKANLTFHF